MNQNWIATYSLARTRQKELLDEARRAHLVSALRAGRRRAKPPLRSLTADKAATVPGTAAGGSHRGAGEDRAVNS
jgi:hypothetical protein